MMLTSIFYCIAGFASVVMGDDQIQDFCRRFEHRTAVVNNKLYIDGGKWNAQSAGSMNNLTSKSSSWFSRIAKA
jgi:hypothetical protein